MSAKDWLVKTYVDTAEMNLAGIMPLVELTVVFERDTPPSPLMIEMLCNILIPEGKPLASEIIEIKK